METIKMKKEIYIRIKDFNILARDEKEEFDYLLAKIQDIGRHEEFQNNDEYDFNEVLHRADELNFDDRVSIHHILGEAEAVFALDYFGIHVDLEALIVKTNDAFDVDRAIEVVNCYLDIVEEEDTSLYTKSIISEAEDYNAYTRPHRGADDGTFDYAGTYVLAILDLIKALQN